MTVTHVVLLKFKPEISEQDGKEVLRAIAALKDNAPGIETVQLGVTFSARSKGFTHGFTMTFKDKAALEAYDKSEAHVNLVKGSLSQRVEDILIFDYEVEEFSIPRPQL